MNKSRTDTNHFTEGNIKTKIHAKNTICWHLTKLCNLKCPFCPNSQDREPIIQQVKYLKKNWVLFKKGFENLPGQWEIFLMGGEPLSVPGFMDIVRDLIAMGHKVSLATNFSYSRELYEKFLNIVDGQLCLFFATFKPEYYKLEPFLKKSKHINQMVQKMGGSFGIGAVAEPEKLNHLYEIGCKFREEGIVYKLQAKKENGQYIEYSESDEQKIREFGKHFGLNGNNSFKGRFCLSGINYFVLNEYGQAFRCHDAMGSLKNNPDHLGNFLKGNLKLFSNPRKCPYDYCSCVNAYNKDLIT